ERPCSCAFCTGTRRLHRSTPHICHHEGTGRGWRGGGARGAGSGRRGRGAARARPARVTRRGGGDTTTPAASGRCRGRRASRSRGRSEERPERSDAADVRGLQTLGALLDVELHALVLLEVATAAADDGAEVSEHISGAVLGGDE